MINKRIITSHEVFDVSSLFLRGIVQCQLRKSLNRNAFILYIYNYRYLHVYTPVKTSFFLGSMFTSVKPLFKDWKKYSQIGAVLCLS